MGVNSDDFREITGVSEELKEDKESWCKFLPHLKERGLDGVALALSDESLGLVESLPDFSRRHSGSVALSTGIETYLSNCQ
ncbi:MAG: transposase [Planctomycetota bacterium]|nr:transposase [Planctomycetota bacterium]